MNRYDLRRALSHELESLGWMSEVAISYGKGRPSEGKSGQRRKIIDFAKEMIGLELVIGKRQFVESSLFVDYPILVRGGRVEIAVILVPTASLLKQVLAMNASSYEAICDQFTDLGPLPLKYPFVVLGLSNEPRPFQVTELTSELDQLLIDTAGLSLAEIVLLNETQNYELKELLPRNEKIAQAACAFANLSGGGILLLGVDKYGNIRGLPKGKELDDMQLRVADVIHNNCAPQPRFEIRIFDAPNDPGRCLLTVRVYEVENKPCMTQDRVYVRSGTSARPAGPDEIRRLILR